MCTQRRASRRVLIFFSYVVHTGISSVSRNDWRRAPVFFSSYLVTMRASASVGVGVVILLALHLCTHTAFASYSAQLYFRINGDQVSATTIDPGGNLVYVNFYNCVLRLNGDFSVTLLAGNCATGSSFSGVPGVATSAVLGSLTGLAYDSAGNLYVPPPSEPCALEVSVQSTNRSVN